ncbi:metalloproteinase inhibitor 2-like [Brevipalpus obovatus]|uniref:metalloproteinase inhibitor 2-like n=1 Tax=Brevipalpus obovatus TaxID=246614 RepID=UPI003D9F12F2
MKLFILPMLLSIIFINLYGIRLTNACTCMPIQLQNFFCRASFAAIVYVIKDEFNRSNIIDDRVYTTNVIQVFKPSSMNVESIKLLTAQDSAMCGEDLRVNQTYLTLGELMEDGQVRINLCGFTRELSSIKSQQLEGFSGKYDCDCLVTDERISSNWRYGSDKLNNLEKLRATMNNRNCYSPGFRSPSHCESSYSFCRRIEDPNLSPVQNEGDTSYQLQRAKPTSTCEWDRNPDYLRCLEERSKRE